MNGYERKIKELNIGLENAENTYYAIKMELDNAKERIKELEREKASLIKTQEFHLEQIKTLEEANHHTRVHLMNALKTINAIKDALKDPAK